MLFSSLTLLFVLLLAVVLFVFTSLCGEDKRDLNFLTIGLFTSFAAIVEGVSVLFLSSGCACGGLCTELLISEDSLLNLLDELAGSSENVSVSVFHARSSLEPITAAVP